MGRYSQQDRAFRVSVPSLDEDTLLLEGFSGEEHVSDLFDFKLEMVSENDAIAAADVLREPFVLLIRLPDGSDRYIHGICARFAQHGKDEGLTSYQAWIVPWLHLLSLNRDCKIFQEKTVLEIIEEVFSKYDLADYEVRCLESYSPREYCVQYRESDLNFVSRLMEEEGIFYFFEHSDEGHKLILADDGSVIEDCEGQDYFRVAATPGARIEEDVITNLEREYQVYTNKVTLTDYDPLHPSLNLESSASDEEHEEVYDYPGRYAELSAGERYASLLLEEEAAGYDMVRGLGRCRAFRSGYKFELSEHYRQDFNQAYFLLSVWHSGHGGGYRTSETHTEYSNEFVCIPATAPFRPPRRTSKPLVSGSQTALVVGPSGEEIYSDRHGRVKVQFYWDRLGQKDENSSCWIRVSHPWAGKGWGAVAIPRMGQEVIVDFLEGDPDRPIITGRVYNAEQTPPYELPGNQTQTGVKSRSSKSGGTSNFNEIRFEDKKGSEQLYTHAEKDQQEVIEHDLSTSVGANQSLSVGGDRSVTVEKNETIEVKGTTGRTTTVNPGKSETTVHDEIKLTSDTGQITVTAKAQGIKVDAKVQAHLLGQDNVLVERDGGHCIEVFGGQVLLTCGGSLVDMGDSVITLTSSTINLNASSIVLDAGGGKVTVDGSGVTINGPNITVSGGPIKLN